MKFNFLTTSYETKLPATYEFDVPVLDTVTNVSIRRGSDTAQPELFALITAEEYVTSESKPWLNELNDLYTFIKTPNKFNGGTCNITTKTGMVFTFSDITTLNISYDYDYDEDAKKDRQLFSLELLKEIK